ncbi:MAG TPA: carboxyl transferase domain-containing protein [Candidatus Limiplasma sp.]|nr:carboxyl transferase domain-containing protein [Candidatus Limiplasma sp.]HPS81927.1 carboxyl transferase domain-containing protein [Candidatus Limiplasma sp.]
MQNSQDLQKVQELRDALNAGEEKRLKAQRDAGKMTARERIGKLVDAGSFVELFAFVSDSDDAAGVVTGYATVQDRPVYLFAQDFTVHGGAMGKLQAQKINKVLDMALKTGAPVLALCDSAGVRIDEGAAAMNAYAEIYRNMARLSGVVPMIALVLGPCIGGAALISQLADVSVMAKNVGSMMVFGPQVLAAMNGMDVKLDALGGAVTMAKQGAVSLVAANEDEAIALASQVLSLLPGSSIEDADILDSDDLNRLLPEVDATDAAALMNQILDAGTLLELKAEYETGVHTAMGRIGGHSVGLVLTAGGSLTAGALQKAARFVHFMDCFNLPVVSLIHTEGVKVDRIDNQSWLMNAQSQLLYAYATATVPKLAVITGSAIGQAYVAMGGKANADVTFAWPGAVVSALTPEAAVAVLYADQVKTDKALTPADARAKYAGEYIDSVAGAMNAAKAGLVDDVIDPAQTRKLLIASLEMLVSKRDSNPAKKHGNMPL